MEAAEEQKPPYEVHETLYCQCGFPVIYCYFRSAAKAKSLGCREFLASTNPELYTQIYKEAPPEQPAEGAETVESYEDGEEQEEESGSENVIEQKLKIPLNQVPPFGIVIKPHLKRLPTYVPILQIRLAARGYRKSLTQVFNFEDFVDDAQAVCKELGKKFSASAGISYLADGQADVIQVQGAVAAELREYFVARGVPDDQIFQAYEAKHKGKKKSQRNSRPSNKK